MQPHPDFSCEHDDGNFFLKKIHCALNFQPSGFSYGVSIRVKSAQSMEEDEWNVDDDVKEYR